MTQEYVPPDAYGLLRRIVDRGPQRIRREQVGLDDCANYLVSRGLASANSASDRIQNTDAGRAVGLIEFDPA